MAKRGRPPDHQRRQQVVALRSRGLTFKQIARQLGVTYQAVQQLFASVAGPEQDPLRKPPLTVAQILEWADHYHEQTGRWPVSTSGPIRDAPNETWRKVAAALKYGCRGLPGGSSLARLLARRRGRRNPRCPPRLTVKQILAWADAHRAQNGQWPRRRSAPVEGAPEETWQRIDAALKEGRRGLPGGSSLLKLLKQHRGIPDPHGRWRDGLPASEGGKWSAAEEAMLGVLPDAEVVRRTGRTLKAVQGRRKRIEVEGRRRENR